MSHVVSFSDGEVIDLHTKEGAYKHVGRFLRENGASGDVFSSFGKLFPDEDNFLYSALREIVERIEMCGASPELTNAVSLASDLCSAIGNEHNPPDKFAEDRVKAALAVSRLMKHKDKCGEKSKRIYG